MFALNECSVDLKAIYHLGCMFWMCLWNYLKRCTLKYYDTFRVVKMAHYEATPALPDMKTAVLL